ncbi:MAG TPA: thiamine pyrophosphate-binding protein [Candidatus Sulfotelmatobacter sp.]|nr:thiamine pyrophosphate-binding protein [Candidatus Sulfotelmatobacter sp.]
MGSQAAYGSDLVVEMLRALGVPYVALNPGATFRGLHDSFVNFGGGNDPEMILCCHEEIAVAVAHGYAKATGRPMAAAVHNIVGLQHASMAIYNAWCDRTPVLVLGGTGPMDETLRRPWIDWVHTALVQGQQVRDYVKWDDQPASVGAIPESLLRAYRVAMTEPRGPVYVCYDVMLQEEHLAQPVPLPPVARYAPPAPPAPEAAGLERLAAQLVEAERPVVFAEDVSRNPAALGPLAELAELLALPVLDVQGRVNLPSRHALNLTGAGRELLPEADLVLALDVLDLYGPLTAGLRERNAPRVVPETAQIVTISLNDFLQRSWAADYNRLVPVDTALAGDTAVALPALVAACRARLAGVPGAAARIAERRKALAALRQTMHDRWRREVTDVAPGGAISYPRLVAGVWEAVKGSDWVVANDHYASPWVRRLWDIREPRQYVGHCRGAGLGYGIGSAVGVALAHRGTGRLCVNMQTDGDFLYSPSALYTMAHHRVPLLTVVCNNRSYGNDEHHQERVAKDRGRPVENKGVGIHINDPAVDFATLARSFDIHATGPVQRPEELPKVLGEAARYVRERQRPALVDVVTRI